MNSCIRINNSETKGCKILLVMTISKTSNINNRKSKKNRLAKKPNTLITQLNSLSKTYKKCMNKGKEGKNKKWNMQEKFKD